jgi:hypothetical protein
VNESDGEQRPEAALAASASCLILIAIGLFLQVQTRDPFAVQWKGGGVSVSSLTWVVMYLAFATVGKVLVARSAGAVGWLCLVIGLIQSISFFTGRYAAFALFQSNGGVPIGEWAAWVASWTFGPTLGALGLLLLVFPDGRFMSMRWRAMAWVSSAAVAAQTLAVALKPGPTTYSLRGGSLVNPAGVEWLGGVTEPLSELAGIGAMLLLVTGVVSLVVRYIRASASQRVQIRCVATAGAALVFVLVAALLAIAFGSAGEGGQNTGLGEAFAALVGLGLAGIPIAIGMAMFRRART